MPRSSHNSSGEAGFSMIEVIISSVLVLGIALSTFTVIDVTGKESANAQARSVAESLLSSEQQRLRSLSATRSLASYSTSTTVTAPTGTATKSFTVASQVDQIRDAGGEVSCTTDTSAPDYLRSTTSVSWPGGRKPLTSSTLIAPSPGSVGTDVGTLAVHVANGAGDDVQGLSVVVGSKTLTTNALGCAVFGYVPAGTTAIAASQSGWVEPDGSSPARTSATVIARQTTKAELRFDQGGSLAVTFTTADRAGTVSTPTTSQSASLTNPDTEFPRSDFALTQTSPRQVTITGLFPFTGNYSAYAGSCAANDPALYGATQTSVPVLGGRSASLAVRMPRLSVKVLNANGSAAVSGATVLLRTTGSGCDEIYRGTTDTNGLTTVPVPYGPYTACAYTSANRTTSASTASSDGSLRNTDPLGDTTTLAPSSPSASAAATSVTQLKLATSSTAGTC